MSLLTQASLIVTPNAVKEGKLYSVIPSNGNGDMTVVRATGATRTNELGLIEPTPYNLLSYSEMFSDALWVKNASSISINTTNSPSGSLTADTLIDTSVNAIHRLRFGVSLSSLTNYTLSVYAKKNTLSFFQLALINTLDSATSSRVFDLQNGVLGEQLSTATLINSSITNVGNDWYLCSITASLPSNPNQFQITLATLATGNLTTANQVTYLGSGNGSIFLWGAQLVQGSVPKDYFYTTDRLNVPRLNYDSVGGCPSILVEPQRTNLVPYSEMFADASWIKTNSATVTANVDVSPAGTLAADRLTAGATLSQIQNIATVLSGSAYTVSIWIKRITGTGQVYLRAIENINTPITITNDWVRYSVTTTATSTIGRVGIALQTSGDVISIWGAQLELGAYSTSYIPTVGTSVTRNADVISKTGISDLIGQTEGTFFAEFALNTSVNFQTDIRITAGTGNEIIIFNTGLRPTVNVTSANVQIFSTVNVLDNTTLGANNKIAVGYKNNDFVVYQNGVLKFSQNTGNVPLSLPDLVLSNGSRSYLLKNTVLFKTRLTNSEIAQLTTL